MSLRHVVELGNAIANGDLDLRAVVDKADSEPEDGEEILDPKPFLKLVGKLRRLHQAQEQYRQDLTRSRLSRKRRAILTRKQSGLREKIAVLMQEFRLSSSRIEEMVQQLKNAAERLVVLEKQEGNLSKGNRSTTTGGNEDH